MLRLTGACLSADSEDGQAGHVQNGPASVSHDAAREAHPSRGGSAGNPSSTAAGSSSGKTAVSYLTNVCAQHLQRLFKHCYSHHHHHIGCVRITLFYSSSSSTTTSVTTTNTTTTMVFFATITTSPPWHACLCLCHSLVAF